MKIDVNTKMVSSKLQEKRKLMPISISSDIETVEMLERLQKHYNVKSRSNLINALIHGAAEAIKENK
jgi:hypothetical protein